VETLSRYLLRLAELELIDHERRTGGRRNRAARLLVMAIKSFDTVGFAAIPSLNKPLVFEFPPLTGAAIGSGRTSN
jgi:hypothetical protein